MPVRSNVQLEITGLVDGTYTVTPFDTWKGEWLEASTVMCSSGRICRFGLPDFQSDIAVAIQRQS
jgi:hypothetical protein